MTRTALSGEKILITGPAGQIAFPLTEQLARDNDVWGIARFGDAATRAKVDAVGATTRVCDLGGDDFGDLPDDFTYLLHLAVFMGPGLDFDQALRVNAEGTGRLLAHCRNAKAALVMSTHSVYRPNPDPMHVYAETDPLGEANLVFSPTYSMSKVGEEAVARTCARLFDLPVVIARMNAAYGANGGLPVQHLDAIVAGRPVTTRSDPSPYSLIHQDDINDQVPALLAAASVPATIVNWAGDEPVTVQEWSAYIGELVGRPADVNVVPVPGSQPGAIADVSRRAAITGPCRVTWKDGLRAAFEARHGN